MCEGKLQNNKIKNIKLKIGHLASLWNQAKQVDIYKVNKNKLRICMFITQKHY